MADRKMIPMGIEEHERLRDMAEYFSRSMTGQVEWLINEAYREFMRVPGTNPPTPPNEKNINSMSVGSKPGVKHHDDI